MTILKNFLGEDQPPSIIEIKSMVTFRKMISTRKEIGLKNTTKTVVNQRNPQAKHLTKEHALSVVRRVI